MFLAAIAVGLTLVGAVYVAYNPGGCSDRDVWRAAQQAVVAELVSPATAVFPNFSEVDLGHDLDICIRTVESYVDSQNGFGALVRSEFIVRVVRSENGSLMTLVVNLDQR